MDKIKVLVTGIGGGGNGEQILKALRIATDLDLWIIGTDVMAQSAGKRFIDQFYQLPLAKDPEYSNELFEILEQERVQFIFHGSEPELAFISENREQFGERNIHTCLNSKGLMRLCMNKLETYQALVSHGFNVPAYKHVKTVDDLKGIDFFPVVLKPNTGSGGSNHTYICRDAEEVDLLGRYLLKLSIDVIAQAYVGSPDDEYTIGVNSDASGNVLGSIAIKRVIGNAISTRSRFPALNNNQPLVISSGFSQGWVCHEPVLQKQAETLANALRSTGPLNIQCRWVEGELMLMEINPRLSGTTSLRAMAGYNEPAMHIKQILLNTPWQTDYEDKLILRALEEFEVQEASLICP